MPKVDLQVYESLRFVPQAINKVLTHPACSHAALIRVDNTVEFIVPAQNGNYFNPVCKCHVLPVENAVQSGVMLEDGRLLLGCLDGSLYLVRMGDVTPSVKIHSVGGGAVWSLAVRNSLVVMTCEDGAVRIGKLKGDDLVVNKSSDIYATRLLSCAISPDGLYAAAGTSDGQVRIYKTASGSCMKQLKVPGAKEDVKVWSVQWLPDFIVAGDSLGQTTIWHGSLELANSTCFRAHLADVLTVLSVGKECIYAAGIDNRTVQFVLEQKPNPLNTSVLIPTWSKAFSRRINNHDVRSLAVFQDKVLLSGSADGVLKITPLKQAQNKVSDRFYSALPTKACVKLNGWYGTACIETGKLLVLNSGYAPIACINVTNGEHIVDHAITKDGRYVCISTPVSCKFFEYTGTEIRKVVGFENFQVRFVEAAGENVFMGLAGEELYEFKLEGDSAFRSKVISLDFDGSIPTAFSATGSEWAVALSSKVLTGSSGTVSLAESALFVKHVEGKVYAALSNNQLAIVQGGKVKVLPLLKEPLWMNRPILGILAVPEHSSIVLYNENMLISLDGEKGTTVPNIPTNLLHVSYEQGDIRAVHRPWEKVLQDLPPAFALAKYGMK